MTRTARFAFLAVAVAALGGLYLTQKLRRSEPVVLGVRVTHAFSPRGVGPRLGDLSFYLKRGDVVAVSVVDSQGTTVRSLTGARTVPTRTRVRFSWDGRTSDGSLAPDALYRFRIGLARQGRSLTIPTGTLLDTVAARPVVRRISPAHGGGPLILPGSDTAVGHIGGTKGRDVEGFVARTDVSPARVVRTFSLPNKARSLSWDGTIAGLPAPDGTYLLGVNETDWAGNRGSSLLRFRPVAGPPNGHPGVTVRHLAVAPPTVPVAPGRVFEARVDARSHRWAWSLRSVVAGKLLARGKGASRSARIRVPRNARGVVLFSVQGNGRRMTVPVPVSTGRAKLLVVLPSVGWQAWAPVDGDGDGLPDYLALDRPVGLDRLLPPLPVGLRGYGSSVAPLLAVLRGAGLAYDVTTDVALAERVSRLPSQSVGIVLAGDERWLPAETLGRLRSWVARGGRVLDLGLDSLRRTIDIRLGVASRPSAPAVANALGGVPARASSAAADLLVWRDSIGLFSTVGGSVFAPSGWSATARVEPPGRLRAAAGPQTGLAGVAAWTLARGLVIRPGLPRFALAAQADPVKRDLLIQALALTAGQQ